VGVVVVEEGDNTGMVEFQVTEENIAMEEGDNTGMVECQVTEEKIAMVLGALCRPRLPLFGVK
jgi:hypothetical protein